MRYQDDSIEIPVRVVFVFQIQYNNLNVLLKIDYCFGLVAFVRCKSKDL